MRLLKISLYVTLICISTMLYSEHILISDYQRTYIPLHTQDGNLAIALRVFKRNNIPSFLLVNTDNLQTSVVPIAQLSLNNKKVDDYAQWEIANSNYYKLLQKYTAEPYIMENYGITHAKSHVTGNILTIDMCQSSVPFEKAFFEQLANLSTQKPTPVAIAMTGLWMLMHEEDFNYLLSLQQNNKLKITWINHSFSHPYYKDLPDRKNFLLSPMINKDSEILLVEQYLLEAGQTPSVFFRFPGLISDKNLILKIKQFGLLPLGADAWVANQQPITKGGIILVHGNGNEHEGITELTPKLKQLELIDINGNV